MMSNDVENSNANDDVALDTMLDCLQPPELTSLSDRLYANIVSESNNHLVFLFFKQSIWLSLIFMIGGFYLGWQDSAQEYINTQAYFDSLFEGINY